MREDLRTGALLFGLAILSLLDFVRAAPMYDTLLSGASTSNQYCPAPIIHYQKTFPRNSGYATQQRVAYL